MIENLFVQFSILVSIALAVSFIMRLLRQPLIIGYIITGIIVSPFVMNLTSTTELALTLSKFGISFLLFTVGISLNPKVLREIGFVSIVIGIFQVAFTAIAAFLIAEALGFSLVPSLYIAIAMTFSSTIIILKLLSDKGDIESLYGKISVGLLIFQDIVAIIILMFVSTFSGINSSSISSYGINSIITGMAVIIVLFLLSLRALPALLGFIAKSQELLFIFSIGWCFLLASLFYMMGFSVEIGALLAGITLSMSDYHVEIAAKVRPLRDFFLIIFFIMLGLQMQIQSISSIILPAIIFSLFIFIAHPLITLIIMGFLGYTKRTNFFSSITLTQISEFAIIIVALGVSVGHLPQNILSLLTLVGLITIAGSTYMIMYSEKIYQKLSPFLSLFERKTKLRDEIKVEKNYDAVLFGYNRIGFNLLKSLKKLKSSVLVIDFNPETISLLAKMGIDNAYGDADNTELLGSLPLGKIKIAISTIPDIETNLLITKNIHKRNKDAIIIILSHQISDAFKLYEAGATYVLMPHFLGGEYASLMLEKYKTNKKQYDKERQRHIQHLKERLSQGHEHPRLEKENK